MANFSPSSPKHIPAWKKLGLKLKNANEPQEAATGLTNGTYNGTRNNLKRKYSTEPKASETAWTTNGPLNQKKKTKSTLLDNNSTTPVTLSADPTVPKPQLPATPSLQKRKSVTFAPETKAEDGDGIKQYYKKWLTSQQVNDPNFDASKLGPALKPIVPTAARITPEQSAAAPSRTSSPTEGKPTAPKKKKQQKFKPTPKPSHSPQLSSSTASNSSHEYVHPALIYLNAYHTTPIIWKFNKAHQNYLLKHILRLTHVPSQYDSALASYLKGLASENTKARIRREALEIRTEDEKWLVSPDVGSDCADNGDEEENEDGEMGVERETPEQNLARRLQDNTPAL